MKSIFPLFLFYQIFWGSIIAHSETHQNYFVHLKADSPEVRGKIANFIHIDQVIEDSVYAVVNEHDYQKLKQTFPKQFIESHFIENQITDQADLNDDTEEFPNEDQKYHTYNELVAEIHQIHQNHPDLTEVISLGKSLEGRNIIGLKITLQKNKKPNLFTPGILFVGSHHAREHLSTEVPLGLIHHILEKANREKRFQQILKNRIVYIVPMLNPDGAMHDIKGKQYKYWRKNRSLNHDHSFGVDLNRNYSYDWGTGGSSTSPRSDVYMGPTAFSEPETLAIKKFIEENDNIRMMISFHTYSELIMYPWGSRNEGVGGNDELVFKKMAQTMSTWNGYKPQQSSDLYIASGDTCDWAYGDHGIFCFTFELSPKNDFFGGGFYPGAKVIDKVIAANINPALYLIENADNPQGVLQ